MNFFGKRKKLEAKVDTLTNQVKVLDFLLGQVIVLVGTDKVQAKINETARKPAANG